MILPVHKKRVLAAIKRLNGLSRKLEHMVEDGDPTICPKILEIALAMQGHIKHIQGEVLESHLRTCAQNKMNSKSKDAFITELIKVIGLSKR